MHHLSFFKEKKPLPYQTRGDFIHGHYIIFSILFCLVVCYEPQTWGPMVVKTL
jgi:hypothetical protein